jgi:hypothetical protein
MADAAREPLTGIADGLARLNSASEGQGIGDRQERTFEIGREDVIAEAR